MIQPAQKHQTLVASGVKNSSSIAALHQMSDFRHFDNAE
jgi:hypothetical protein